MGRDVTGIHTDRKPNAISVNSNSVSHDAPSRIPTESNDTKDIAVEDHIVEESLDKECQGKQDVLGVKSVNCEVDLPEDNSLKPDNLKSSERTLTSPVKPTSDSVAADNFRKDYKVSQSRSPKIEKRTSNLTVDSYANRSPNARDLHIHKKGENLELHPHLTPKKLHQPDHRNLHDDEDNWSLASSAAVSVRTVRSQVTVPVAPTFSSAERAAKRQEYYKKLEEKHKALEAERKEYEARMKEEQAAAIKQLRKSMVVKAKPVPSFYHEGPPPKAEPKKLPVTRAKSPNLTRRRSCGDAVHSSMEKGACAHGNRHSLGIYRECNNTGSNLRNKNQINGRNGNGSCKVKDRTKLESEKQKASPKKMTEERTVDISVA